MTEAIRSELDRLQPEIPWAHHYDLHGVETISRERHEQFYKRALVVKELGRAALSYYKTFSRGVPLSAARVLDVASAEGGIAVDFAQAGAKEVIGVEGRRLYVDRANFAIRALGLSNVRCILGDVRKIDPALGPFDFIVCSGILHHLGQEDFFPFLKSMAALSKGAMFLYTHVSIPAAIERFGLAGPVEVEGQFKGWLYREHANTATAQQKENRVRASLDNTFSFWATEESLIAALKKAGFNTVAKMFEPHAYGNPAIRNLRTIFLCLKDA